jgi:hypothetical protein
MHRPARIARHQFLDRLEHALPHRHAMNVARLYELIDAHRIVHRCVGAVLINEQLGGAVDVFVVHSGIVARDPPAEAVRRAMDANRYSGSVLIIRRYSLSGNAIKVSVDTFRCFPTDNKNLAAASSLGRS